MLVDQLYTSAFAFCFCQDLNMTSVRVLSVTQCVIFSMYIGVDYLDDPF